MVDKKTELSVSTEVLEKMTELAACEVEGVKGLSKKSIDLRNAVKNKSAFKGVKIENINGAVEISLYICVTDDARVRDTAEAVQKNVKEKLQTMTGTAVTKINVFIADVEESEEADKEEV